MGAANSTCSGCTTACYRTYPAVTGYTPEGNPIQVQLCSTCIVGSYERCAFCGPFHLRSALRICGISGKCGFKTCVQCHSTFRSDPLAGYPQEIVICHDCLPPPHCYECKGRTNKSLHTCSRCHLHFCEDCVPKDSCVYCQPPEDPALLV